MTSREGNSPAQMGGPDIAKIAAGLTYRQRESLLNAHWIGSGEQAMCVVDFVHDPWPEGVAQFLTLTRDRLTPLGRQVAAHLKEPTP